MTLQLLGGLELRDAEGAAVSLRTRKCGLLLAYLGVAPDRAHSRDQLAGLLWGDRQDEQARGSLRNALSDLRKALGEDALVVDRDVVSLRSGKLSTDYDRLHKATRGETDRVDLAAIYPGEFLEGHDLDTGDFAAWLLAEREKCRALAVRVLEREVARLGEAREFAAAIDRARELLSLDALREESHRTLIRLYAAVGERSMAIAQFRNCRAVIRRELGTDPSPETIALADRVAAESRPAGAADLAAANGPVPLPPPAGHGDLSIAVLPFVNMSGDVEQDYFSDGVAEDIITDLSRIADLHVAARSSTAIYKGATVGPQRIASELGVRYILDGSVRRAGTALRVTAQLVDGRTGRQLWAERYDRQLVSIFDLQDEIASSIVQALRLKISPNEERAIGKRPTRNAEAYQEYLRGRACLREMTRRSVELSSMMFARAVELDPGYAAAYAGLADSLSMLAYHYDDNAALAEALANSERALEVDPELAEAYASRGRARSILDQVDLAEKDFRKAIDLDPRHQEAHFYLALMYLTIGRAKESLEPMRTAFRLADQDLQTGMMLMCSLRANGLSSADVAARMVAVAERRIAVNPSDERATYVGAQALAELGRTAEAMHWARRAAAFDTGDARTGYNLACLFSILGDVDETIGQLRKLLVAGYARRKITWIRRHDPDLDNARKDARFEALFADYPDGAG